MDLAFADGGCASTGAQLSLSLVVHSMQRTFVYDTADVGATFESQYTPLSQRMLADRADAASAAAVVKTELEEGPVVVLQSQVQGLTTHQQQMVGGLV